MRQNLTSDHGLCMAYFKGNCEVDVIHYVSNGRSATAQRPAL